MTTATPELNTREQVIDYLLSFDLFKHNEYEGYAYVNNAIGRFLLTMQMLPPASAPGARLLELGANPYFLTLLIKKLHGYDMALANYFGAQETRREAEQTITSEKYGETHTFRYAHFNIEHDDFPFEDNSFEGVLFCEILEHLTVNPTHTLSEIHRVLKPGGFVIVTTPNMLRWEHLWNLARGHNINDLYSGHGVYGRHNREYAPQEVIQLLRDCGFAVQELRLANILHKEPLDYLISAIRAHWKEHIFARAQAVTQPPYRYKPWLYASAGSLRRVTSGDVVIGQNDELHTGIGWHPADRLSDSGSAEFVRWTQHAAELFLHSSGGENTIAAVVNPGPASLGAVQVTLKSNGATVSATPPFENWTPLHLPLAACEGGEEVRLLIEVDQLRCPFALGAHNDLRNLGVMVQRALLYRMTSELVMGEHDPVCYSGAGWYHLEDGLRWTQQSAELFLRASGGEQQLVVETNPGSEKLGPVTVCLRCGEQQQEYLMDRDGWTTLSLALPACEADEMVRVQIEVDRLRCPAEVGLSPDPRSLGVMVRRAALTAAADEMTEA